MLARLFKPSAARRDTPKPVILLLNYVLNDGVGDLFHFLDIHAAMKKHEDDYKLVSVISYQPKKDGAKDNKNFIARLLDQHNISNAYLFPYNQIDLHSNLAIIADLTRTVLILEVSFDFSQLNRVVNCIYPLPSVKKIPLLYCGEHERRRSQPVSSNVHMIHYSMGLGGGSFGLKIAPQHRLPKLTHLHSILNVDFKKALLGNLTDTEFLASNFIIPAYVSNTSVLTLFLNLLTKSKPTAGMNLTVILSCKNIGILMDDVMSILKAKWDHAYAEIKFVHRSDDSIVTKMYDLDLQRQQTIRIVSGFWLSDHDYHHIRSMADMMCVTGDNTFKESVSYKALPLYFPTYPVVKRATITGLRSLLRHIFPEEIEIQRLFKIFFAPMQRSYFNKNDTNQAHLRELTRLDFIELARYWPRVCDYIAQHHNYYQALDAEVGRHLSARSGLSSEIRSGYNTRS